MLSIVQTESPSTHINSVYYYFIKQIAQKPQETKPFIGQRKDIGIKESVPKWHVDRNTELKEWSLFGRVMSCIFISLRNNCSE